MSSRAHGALVLAALALGACAPGFPERAQDVGLARDAAPCLDFRKVDLWTPWDLAADRRAEDEPLGCSTARSLPVMVADPGDLERGVGGPPRSGTAAAAVGRYGADQRKPLPALSTLESVR